MTRWRWVAAAAAALMAGAQIAIPLADDDRALTIAVIAGFALATTALVCDRWGARRGLAGAAGVAVATFVLERVGSTTGFPFGEYHYTDALRPQLGDVPLVVPLAWWAMGVPALVVGRHVTRSHVGSVVVGALALTAWDLFLDPQMVDAGYWVWAADGAYRGIPLTNYAGWLGSAVVLLAGVSALLPHRPVAPTADPLLWLYTWWAVMNTIGFVVFFGDPFVGVVGGIAMGGATVAAWRAPELARG